MTTQTTTQPNLTTRAKPKPKPRPRKLLTTQQLTTTEKTLKQKYPHIKDGTLRNATKGMATPGYTPEEITKYNHKRSVTINCTNDGCNNQRRIATSDLAQVKLCENCTRLARNTRKRARRAAAKTK
jgi:hypothetical protein